jgi:hypothetical protein
MLSCQSTYCHSIHAPHECLDADSVHEAHSCMAVGCLQEAGGHLAEGPHRGHAHKPAERHRQGVTTKGMGYTSAS